MNTSKLVYIQYLHTNVHRCPACIGGETQLLSENLSYVYIHCDKGRIRNTFEQLNNLLLNFHMFLY